MDYKLKLVKIVSFLMNWSGCVLLPVNMNVWDKNHVHFQLTTSDAQQSKQCRLLKNLENWEYYHKTKITLFELGDVVYYYAINFFYKPTFVFYCNEFILSFKVYVSIW